MRRIKKSLLFAAALVSFYFAPLAVLEAGVPVSGKSPPAVASEPDRSPPVIIEGRKASSGGVLVKVRKGVTQAVALSGVMAESGMKVGREFDHVPGLKLLVPSTGSGPAAMDAKGLSSRIKALRASGQFEYVEPDWEVTVLQAPNDSAYLNGDLWGLRNIGQNSGVAGVDVNAVSAWNLTAGSPSVVVGVIDSGIRYTHQDIASNMWTNPGEIPGNGIDDDRNGYIDDVYGINAITGSGDPFDDNDHGTHCAGTIAASAFDTGPHVGVAYNVRLMGLKFLSAGGSGNTSDAITCIEYAIEQGVDILSNSWGGGGFSWSLRNAIRAANDAGILFVAAAGNSFSDNDQSPHYPSSYDVPNVIAVSAIDRTGALASFSSYGATSVDIAAPGVAIFSTTAASDSSYDYFNGTSMATPHVAGVAALVASYYPSAGVTELKERILNTAAPLPSLSSRVASGGMVDAHTALTAAADGILELRANSNGALEAGAPNDIFITVRDLTPVLGARVDAYFDGEPTVIFLDTGTDPDQFASDGVYTASLDVPTGLSTVNLNVEVSGPGKTSANGVFPLTVATPPVNDNFADRLALLPHTTQTTGTNVFASEETGEPVNPSVAGGSSVWWSWDAPEDGSVTISTTGSNYDTTLAIYEGDSLATLALVGANDDSSGLQSAVTFTAIAGLTYQLQVNGYAGREGDIQLNYPSPGVGAEQSPLIITQPVARSVIIGDPFELSVVAAGSPSLTYQWYLDDSPISEADDDTYSVLNSERSDEGSYTVMISNGFGQILSNPAFVSVDAVGLAPVNDDFDAAEIIEGSSGTFSGTNIRATGELGEPSHAGVSDPQSSVWWIWTAPSNGQVAIDTLGSDFNTTLAAYTGGTLGALAEVASNDDSGTLQSRISFFAVSGTSYAIAVDGFGSAEGEINLTVAFIPESGGQPNDNFVTRIELPGFTTVTGSNIGAGGDAGEPSHAGASAPLASVWWTWTAPFDGAVAIDTFGSDFDTTLGVYTGSAVDALTVIASDDDTSGRQSRVTFTAVSGTSYAIAVDGYASAEGNINLTIAAATTGDDHGDSTDSATPVALNTTTSGVLTAGDRDYFRIDVRGPGTLVVSTTGNTDTFGYLLNTSGSTLEQDDDGGSDLNFRISYSISSAGTYYVWVEGYSSLTEGSYQFVSSFTEGSQRLSIFQRILDFFRNLFSRLFGFGLSTTADAPDSKAVPIEKPGKASRDAEKVDPAKTVVLDFKTTTEDNEEPPVTIEGYVVENTLNDEPAGKILLVTYVAPVGYGQPFLVECSSSGVYWEMAEALTSETVPATDQSGLDEGFERLEYRATYDASDDQCNFFRIAVE